MELMRDGLQDSLDQLINDLTLLQPPMFIYAARPSAVALKRLLKLTSSTKGQLQQVHRAGGG
jgi:hypothetical protein